MGIGALVGESCPAGVCMLGCVEGLGYRVSIIFFEYLFLLLKTFSLELSLKAIQEDVAALSCPRSPRCVLHAFAASRFRV